MNNLAKLLITALIIIAGVFAYSSYKAGGLDNIKSEIPSKEVDVEAH